MQRDLFSLHLGGVAGGSLKPIFEPQDSSKILRSLTELVFGRTLKIISVLLFSDGYSRLGKLGRRMSAGLDG